MVTVTLCDSWSYVPKDQAHLFDFWNLFVGHLSCQWNVHLPGGCQARWPEGVILVDNPAWTYLSAIPALDPYMWEAMKNRSSTEVWKDHLAILVIRILGFMSLECFMVYDIKSWVVWFPAGDSDSPVQVTNQAMQEGSNSEQPEETLSTAALQGTRGRCRLLM